MKLKVLIAGFSFVFFSVQQSYAQDSDLPRLDGDTLTTTSGFKVARGQKIKIGVGTMPDGSFKFIRRNASSLFNYSSVNQAAANSANSLQRNASGFSYTVDKIMKRGNKSLGYNFYLKFGLGILNYEVDVENAIASGEVVVPAEFKKISTSAATQSLGDELKKLKDLFDNGTLTKEEYDAAKKKLLN